MTTACMCRFGRGPPELLFFCELPEGHGGEHGAPSRTRPAVMEPGETDRWWQAFCAFGKADWLDEAVDRDCGEWSFRQAADKADAAIAEARTRGRL